YCQERPKNEECHRATTQLLSLITQSPLGESMTVSLPNRVDSAHIETRYRVDRDCAGLDDTPASTTDRDFLLAHLGRDVLHGKVTRDFKKAYRRNKAGDVSPRMYRTDSEAHGKCEYVKLTSKQYAAVLVVDIDQPGEAGGHPADLALYVRNDVLVLVAHNLGPAWVGVNPISGKVQFIWLIDPVYADASGKSSQMMLLAATTHTLGELLGHDPHFAHGFSRNPFYTGKSPSA